MGIGNPEKGNDAFGPVCADLIRTRMGTNLSTEILIINAGTVPENYTGQIRNFNASHVLIIDAVFADKKPGVLFEVNPDLIDDNEISTHRMPLNMLYLFLQKSMKTKIMIIGRQSENMVLDVSLSKKLIKSADILTNYIISILSQKIIK